MADAVVVAKPWYKSTTIWFNLAAVIVLALHILVVSKTISDPDVLAILLAVINLLNRLRTSQAVIPGI